MHQYTKQNQPLPATLCSEAQTNTQLPLNGLAASVCVHFSFPAPQSIALLAPALLALAIAAPVYSQPESGDSKYSFDTEEYRSLQYSTDDSTTSITDHHTRFRFKLSPGKFDFSLAGGFGLGGVFANPEFALSSSTRDRYSIDRKLPELHDGLSYSAGIDIEHDIEREIEHITDTAYVSSGQLGLNYGRMGRVWYNGVDLSFHQSGSLSDTANKNEVMSFDLTTGRRLGITGIGQEDPLWLLSLRGDFDFNNAEGLYLDESSGHGDWTLNPTLFWDRPGFRFAAQLELPIDEDTLRDFEPPDYKLRAVIEKSFK